VIDDAFFSLCPSHLLLLSATYFKLVHQQCAQFSSGSIKLLDYISRKRYQCNHLNLMHFDVDEKRLMESSLLVVDDDEKVHALFCF